MLSGTVTYGSYIEGIEIEAIEIPSAEPSVPRIEVASDKHGNISIAVHVEEVSNEEEAQALGLREATRVVNILAIEQGIFVKDPGYKGHALTDDSNPGHRLGNSVTCFTQAYCVKKVGGESLAALRSALADPAPPGEPDYQLFRLCLSTTDVASKFLSLYRLLGRLADPTGADSQRTIDALIRRHEPGVAESPSPRSGGTETVYTKLRNEHMHRSAIPLDRVRADMSTLLPGLIAITRKAIKHP